MIIIKQSLNPLNNLTLLIDIKVVFWYNLKGDKLKYPNNIAKKNIKITNYGNRGQDLESIINQANEYYLDKDIAIIYKKPTPITVLKVTNNQIVNGFYKEKSTLDYVGLYKGKYIEFDAKKTILKYLPLSNIHLHQLKHIERIIKNSGISFLIIEIMNEYYLLPGEKLLLFIEINNRKSIPYDYIKENGFKLKYNYLYGLRYIEELENLLWKK